ncbi:MAG: hypothetical protein LBB27_01305 [Tannerellaceae bacterium]|jgi:hypothetical protein|nr:hypothetical protein [Tannerellaceae bacterium]
MKEMAEEKEKNGKRLTLLHVLGGGILKDDFVVRHTKMIVFVVALILVYIGNRYTCMQKLRDIDRLQQELRDVHFEALSISSELTGRSRQSQVEAMVEALDLPLSVSAPPPYELHR